jgi:hypothetical protein
MLKKTLAVLVVPLLLLLGRSESGSGNSAAQFGQTSSVSSTATGTTGARAVPSKSLSQNVTKAGRSQFLPYDVRPNLAAPQRSRGFHNVNDLLPDAARSEVSTTPPARPLSSVGVCPPTITQSTSQAIATGAVTCSDPGVGTLENHYWRAFNMNEFAGGQAYNITSGGVRD